MRTLLYVITAVILILIGFLFGSVNQQIVELNLLVIRAELRVVDIALLFLLSGLIIGFSLALLLSLKRKASRWLKKSPDSQA